MTKAMSTSQELTRVPPELALRPILITNRLINDHGAILLEAKTDENDGEGCRTPTSEESRLPSIPRSCPGAPRKRRPAIRCKRRLFEIEYLSVGAEELDCLFRHRDQLALAPKRVKKAKISSSC